MRRTFLLVRSYSGGKKLKTFKSWMVLRLFIGHVCLWSRKNWRFLKIFVYSVSFGILFIYFSKSK